MTKWRFSVTALRPTRLLQLIMVLGVIKLGLIFTMPVYQSGESDSRRDQPTPTVETRLAVAAPEEEQEEDQEEAQEVVEEDISPQMQRLREREAELDRRERNLRQLEEELDRKLEELREKQAEVEEMLKEADVKRDEKIEHLIDVYSNMQPREAAQVIENLDQEVAVKILSGMRGREAGQILDNIDPQMAARISEQLSDLHLPFDR